MKETKAVRLDASRSQSDSYNSIPLGEPVYGDEERPVTYYKNEYGGKLPIGSRRLQKRERRRVTLKYLSRLLFLGGAVGLLLISAVRLAFVSSSSFEQVLVDFYFLLFGVITTLNQLGIKKFNKKIRLLGYNWGKCVYCVFLASLSFAGSDDDVFLQAIMAIYFFGCACIFFALSFLDRENDLAQYRRDFGLVKKQKRYGEESSSEESDQEGDTEELGIDKAAKDFLGWVGVGKASPEIRIRALPVPSSDIESHSSSERRHRSSKKSKKSHHKSHHLHRSRDPDPYHQEEVILQQQHHEKKKSKKKQQKKQQHKKRPKSSDISYSGNDL